MVDVEITIPFGKYRDGPLSEVPRPYLGYVLSFPNLDPGMALAVRAELSRRGLGFGKHKDKPLAKVPGWYLKWLVESDFEKELELR